MEELPYWAKHWWSMDSSLSLYSCIGLFLRRCGVFGVPCQGCLDIRTPAGAKFDVASSYGQVPVIMGGDFHHDPVHLKLRRKVWPLVNPLVDYDILSGPQHVVLLRQKDPSTPLPCLPWSIQLVDYQNKCHILVQAGINRQASN